MVIHVALGVPEGFMPKAKYAIQVLLAPYGATVVWVDHQELTRLGGLYYGALPVNLHPTEQPLVCIESLPATWHFFESKQRYDPAAAFHAEWNRSGSVPVLFGSPQIAINQEGTSSVHADIVASAFFWLSDWQDAVRSERDPHGRQPFHGSMQQYLQLHTRAVVDEYSGLLASWLGLPAPAGEGGVGWKTIFSHDIDRIRKKTPGIAVRETLHYLMLNRGNAPLKERISRWQRSMGQLMRGSDAYEASILRILHEHRSQGGGGCLLFKSVLKRHAHDAKDYLGHSFFDQIVSEMHSQQTEFGYHSGYEAGWDPSQLRMEHGRLCERLGMDVTVHRSHYLRYRQDLLFPTLEKLGIVVDSSIAWAEQTGFRAQTCRPYPIFDLNQNRPLNVLEIPLAIMDTQPFGYMGLDVEDAIDDASAIVKTVKRHGGVLVWNFHHHIFDDIDAPSWHLLMEAAFEMCASVPKTTFNSTYLQNAHVYF